MQCKRIISIIIHPKDVKDPELKTCDDLLALRYKDIGYISDDIYLSQYTSEKYEVPNINKDLQTLINISNEWVTNGRKNSNGLGLYIQTHGNAQGPVMKNGPVVGAVLALYNLGLRFRKINLGWCSSGGGQIYTAEQSSSVDFIKLLVTELDSVKPLNIKVTGNLDTNIESLHIEDPDRKLDGTLFSAYGTIITFKKSKDIDKNTTEPDKVRNTFKNKYTHPHPNINGILADLENQPKNKFNEFKSKQEKEIRDNLTIAVDYFNKKVIWKVENKKLVRAPISEYTDSKDIAYLHQVIVQHHEMCKV
ncbi:hypothetical protein [Jeongeupia naejangsanensis]|uniref:Uncharacterized protein n=1 Tax=Jeongeupia naejangsanensis TaxID=613195 RepID=A0ABS2BG21_9NEIS|nr:hypothetical protein [Jeongeupia naejangsanensis]MBM3114551.1 hypothetical protein [Jeongeupia naejangsanensis]